MAHFSDLPTEIWLLIAWRIPKSQLFQLKSLNTVFLNCWMDRSWTNLTIRAQDPKYERILQRMVDPFTVTRTKKLTIDLSSPSSNFNPSTLFRTIMSVSIARTLQELTLAGVVEQFASLGEYSTAAHTPQFEALMELSLTLGQDPDSQMPVTSLALEPFFRSLPPTLQVLKIMNFSSLNILSLFDASDFPARYPKIKVLFLETSLQTSYQSLHHFLLTHNNLQHLTLFLYNTDQEQERLDACLVDLVNNNFQFPSLQTLNIRPSTTQTGLLAVLTLIKRTAPTLSALWIRFRCLTCEEVKQVVNALTEGGVQVQAATATITEDPRNLKSLRMRITQLSVPFLDLLARKLPQLEKLDLRVSEIVGSDQHSFNDLLHQRRHDLCLCSASCPIQDHLHVWKLRDLMLVPEKRSMDAMCAVAGAVPSVVR